MSEKVKELEIFEMADKFINIANELVQAQGQEVGRVGTAIRYAAARFNAHDANSKSSNLEDDKENAIEWYTDQYKKMLVENIDAHIKLNKLKNSSNTGLK